MSDHINPSRSASVPSFSDKQPTYSPLVKTIAKLAYAILFPITLPITSAAKSAYEGKQFINSSFLEANSISYGNIGGFFDRIATKIMKVYAKVFDKQPLLKEIAYKEHMFSILDQYSKTFNSIPTKHELKLLMNLYETFTNPLSSPEQKKMAAKKFISEATWKEAGAKNPLLIKQLFNDEVITLNLADIEFAVDFLQSDDPSKLMLFFKLDDSLKDQIVQRLMQKKTKLGISQIGNKILYASEENLKLFFKGDSSTNQLVHTLNQLPVDEKKLEALVQKEDIKKIKFSNNERINKIILRSKENLLKFLKGEKIALQLNQMSGYSAVLSPEIMDYFNTFDMNKTAEEKEEFLQLFRLDGTDEEIKSFYEKCKSIGWNFTPNEKLHLNSRA